MKTFNNIDYWNTLRVTYEDPQVDRLWIPYLGTYRLYLHKIHPCNKPLFHPHPWPSAVKIISGQYEMQVGYGEEEPPVAATIMMTEGSHYEMTHPNGWHSVRPIGKPSLSVMITGTPWARSSPGKKLNPETLPREEAEGLLNEFLSR